MRELVQDAAAGVGRCLLVEGEPGIGKSALLAQALAGADASGCEVLWERCDEWGQRFPLSVMTRLLGVDLRSADPRRAAAARALRREESADGWTMRPLSDDPVAAAVEEMLALVDRLCVQRSVVLVVEDLHWADEASLSMWRQLCQASVQLPLLVVGSCRPVSGRPELERLRSDVRARAGALVSLGPLAEEAVLDLAARLTGCSSGPRLAERLGAAAGNPLYVRELLAAVSRVGALESADGVTELAVGDRAAQALGSLAGVIADRLESLTVGAREVLRMAALLGPEFSVADLGVVVAQGRDALSGQVAEAVAVGVLESAGDRLWFRHDLLKEVLYEATPPTVRVALHQHAAQALIASGAPAERIAELLLPALEAVDGWELDWLADHARELVDRAPQIAAELFEHGLGHTDRSDPRHAVLESHLASVWYWLGRFERAEQLAREIAQSTTDPDRLGQAHWLLFTMAASQGRAEEVARLAEAGPDPRVGELWQARLLALRAQALGFLGRYGDAAEQAAEALAQGERLADPIAKAEALHCRSILEWGNDDLAASLASSDRALAVIGTNQQLHRLRVSILGNRGAVLGDLGWNREAVQSTRLAVSLAEGPQRPHLLVQSAEMNLAYGNWDDALLDFEQAAAGGLTEHFLFIQHGAMALITGRQNAWQQAERHLAALEGQEYPPGWIIGSVYWLQARALAAQRAGRPQESVEVLALLLSPEYAEGVAQRSEYLPGLVRAALAADDRQTAESAAEVCQEEAARGTPVARAYAPWCQGLVRADPALVLAGADHIRELGRRSDLGYVLEDAAALQADAGDIEEARTTLGQALEIYAALGAEWDARRALARLRSSGVLMGVRGLRQRPKTGWGALTATELRVAEQVAAGKSNPDIATDLQLSRRTVETHVSHILTKLHARSRREIADLASAQS